MEKWYAAVTDFVTKNRDQIVADLITLARFPSISQAGKDGLPFGKDVDDVLNAAAAMFRGYGYPMTVNHEGGYAVAVCDGEGDGIGLFGHADVVPVNNDWIKTTPFNPVEENGVLYGRGVNDNKAGVIASLYALRALKAAGVELKSRITLFVGGSEETGMQDMDNFVKNERMPAVSLVPDGGFPVCVGEKGIMRVNATSKNPLQDVTRLDGGKAYNVILDYVDVEVPNTPAIRAALPEAVEAKGKLGFAVEGLTSHAASPEGSVNAAHKATEKLLNLPICDNDKQILSALAKVVSVYYGEALNIDSTGAFGKLTCANGITRVEADGRLTFTLDIRFGSEVSGKELAEKITASLDALGYTTVITECDEGFLLDESGKPLDIILSTCREVFNAPEAAPFKMGGGTYARKLKNAFSLSHSGPWHMENADLPEGHGGGHQSDEALGIDALLDGIKYIALILGRMDAYLCQ